MVSSLHRQASLAAIGLIGAIYTVSGATDIITREQRHNIPPIQKHAQISYTTSQESEYMISPCKPERDGYFGSTSGPPTIIQYGFEMESIINRSADITDALDTIREHVMDILLSYTFPTICAWSRELTTSSSSNHHIYTVNSVTGFHFEDDYDAIQSCIPQQSIQNDCTLFTGLLSIYGSGVTTNTFDTILQIFHVEFPSFRLGIDSNSDRDGSTPGSDGDDAIVNQLIQYGITRLNISDAYTHIMSKPSDPTIDHFSVRNIIAFVLMIVCIAIGIFLIGRYLYMKRQINNCEDRFDMGGKKHSHETKSNRWTIFRKQDETDITEMSSTSSSSSVSTWGNRESNVEILQKIRSLRHPMRRHHQRRQPRTPMELTLPGRAGTMKTDSIYIVESDEEEEEDDDNDDGNANSSIHMGVYSLEENERFYTSGTSLLSDDMERYNYFENDPLYIPSSVSMS